MGERGQISLDMAVIGISVALTMGVAPLTATAQSGVFTDAQRAEIEAIVAGALDERFGGDAAPTGEAPDRVSGGELPDGGGGAARGGGAPLLDGTDPDTLLQIVRNYGDAELGADNAGDPQITGEMEGVRFLLYFYGCTDNRDCRDVIFLAAFADSGADLDTVNSWNRENRFGAAYLDQDGDAWLQMPVNLFGGVSETNWDDTVDWWRVVSQDFRDFVYDN